ncbi:MAG: nitrite reductase small subunit NirD [Pseudomonadota bacterium]
MDGLSPMAEKWLDVCALVDIPERGARRFDIAGLPVGVFRTRSGEIFAIENRCPHMGGPLSEGIVHDSAVTCPLHNWVIDLRSGVARGADDGCVTTYPVEVRQGRVCLKIAI